MASIPRSVHPPAPERPSLGRCPRCGAAVVACRDPAGVLMMVHPVPVPGGELIINGSRNQVVHVLSSREVAYARRRNQLGFTVHQQACQR